MSAYMYRPHLTPTSGFFLMIPRADTVELDMSVDEALKYIVSMGVVTPEHQEKKLIVDPNQTQANDTPQ